MKLGLRILAASGLVAVAAVLGLVVGYGDLSSADLGSEFLRLRGYRVATAAGAGAALSVAGVLVQGLFRNPLASPSILGVSAGASLGGQLSLVLLGGLVPAGVASVVSPEMLLPFGCIAGAVIALLILLAVARLRPDPLTVLLAGFLLSGLFVSVGAFLTAYGQETWELGRAIVLFTLGGVGGSGPRHALLIVGIAVVGLFFAVSWAGALDMLSTGEEEARTLGVDTVAVRRWCVVWAAVLSAGAVAVGGNIAFVGLVIPHIARRLVSESHRPLIFMSAILGAGYLVLADVVCRVVPGTGEMPLGVVTGLIGAPTFLVLLMRSQRLQAAGG